MSALPPPPQHPASGTTTAPGTSTHQVNDGSQGAAAAENVGDKIKGGWNVFHGAGEGIRGNINSLVDNVGEQIAGRGQGEVKPPTRTDGGERPAEVAGKGADEMRAGLNTLHK